MSKIHRTIYYYADVTATAEEILVPGIKEHSFQLLHGPRSSGKSTLCDVTASLVKDDFTVIAVDFECVAVHKEEDDFWKSFGTNLSVNHPFIPQISTSDDFVVAFSQRNWEKNIESSDVAKAMGIVPDKPVLLVIDEFDTLYSLAGRETRKSVLSTLRGIKQNQKTYILRSFIGIGTFSILKLTGEIGYSPFSITDAIPCPNLTEAQVQVLFQEYAKDKSKTIDEDVISDIYYRSAGHAGSVSFFGKLIDEHVNLKRVNCLDTSVWQEFIAKGYSISAAMKWVPMRNMIDQICAPYDECSELSDKVLEKIKKANTILYNRLFSNEPYKPQPHEKLSLEFLAAESVVISLDNEHNEQCFRMRSPLVKSLLVKHLLTLMKPNTIEDTVPMIEDDTRIPIIDVPKMLQIAIKHWKKDYLARYGCVSSKGSRSLGIPKDMPVPREEVYQSELISTIKPWLLEGYDVYSQVKVRTPSDTHYKFCDILISNGPERILFELVAHTTKQDVIDHISRVKEYATILKPSSIYVLHFTTSPKIEDYPFCDEKDTVSLHSENTKEDVSVPVSILHFQHSSSFDAIKVFLSKKEPPITLKLE